MGRETSASRDVQINMTIPVGGDGSTPTTRMHKRSGPAADCDAPWGAHPSPGEVASRLEVIKDLQAPMGSLLDVAHRALRAGRLNPDDLGFLEEVQRWFSCLQEELDCLQRPPPPPPPGK